MYHRVASHHVLGQRYPAAPHAPLLTTASHACPVAHPTHAHGVACMAAASGRGPAGPEPPSNSSQAQVPPPAAASAAGQRKGADPAAVRDSIDRASKMLDQMLEEILRELFVDQATAYVSDEAPMLREQEAVRNAVVTRIEFLDANFFAALSGYIQVASKTQGDAGALTNVLLAVRDEVLRQVALRLPPAARVMERVLQEVDKDARVGVLRRVLYGSTTAGSSGTGSTSVVVEEDELPGGVDGDALLTTATQLIDDMEDQETIADRRLLARMVLAREEVRWLEEEGAFNAGAPPAATTAPPPTDEGGAGTGLQGEPARVPAGPAPPPGAAAAATPNAQPSTTTAGAKRSRVSAATFARKNVPQRCIAFVKELLVVGDPAQRVALLSRALSEDWDGAAPKQKLKRDGAKASSVPDYVRPGRLMATLHALEAQLAVEAAGQGPDGELPILGARSAGEAPDTAKLGAAITRIGDIRAEACAVLDRIQRGQLVAPPR